MKNLLPIGRFSKVTRLSIKVLRRYDELDLLRPALVDPETGYRYYSTAQSIEAERIRQLRLLDVPLDEIRTILRQRDAAAVRASLEVHRARLMERMAETERALDYLQRLMEQEESMTYAVQIKTIESLNILSHRSQTALADLGETFGRSMGLLFGYAGRVGAQPVGPPFSIYHGPEFDEAGFDLEVCVPVHRPLSGDADVDGRLLDGGTVASTLHVGPYTEIGPAYQALATWMTEHGHEAAGSPREIYLVGPGQTDDPAGYQTELIWPLQA